MNAINAFTKKVVALNQRLIQRKRAENERMYNTYNNGSSFDMCRDLHNQAKA
jgi:hypothetical protein